MPKRKTRKGKKSQAKLLSLQRVKTDKALSQLVREETRREYNGLCPLCGRGPLVERKPSRNNPATTEGAVQCCFHFIRRKRQILRWDRRNVIGSCHRCNYIEYKNPDPSRAWFIRKFGADLYLKLVDESAGYKVFTIEELVNIEDFCKLALVNLCQNDL